MGCIESAPREVGNPLVGKQGNNLFESKIVLLGDSAVGKSSLALRFCQGRFPRSHEVTIGAAFMQQTVRLSDGTSHKLNIWDSGGQERFRAMAPLYYRDASGAVIVFDCTSESSFESVKFWINELSQKGPANCLIVVVLNKCDIPEGSREVETSTARSFCDERGIRFFEASALSGQGVSDVFEHLAHNFKK